MQPLISVIVPVYNGQDYLEKCIDSIESQTYKNLEIIIINDGSTDATGQVCVRLQEKSSNIHVITMKDEGVSAARNAGLDVAKGEFITFVDADDRILPNMLEVLYNGIASTGSDVCGCRFLMWKTEAEWEKLLGICPSIEDAQTYQSEDYWEKEILNGNSRCWSKLYKRETIGELRFKIGLTIGEDMLFLVELLSNVRSLSEMNYPGYGYYQNPTGAMNRGFHPGYMDQITCWELARSKMPDKPEVQGRVTTILIISILLTVGKIAALSGKERREYRKYVDTCRDKLKEAIKVKGAYEGLSKGYKIKVNVFRRVPFLYLGLYHIRKYKK